MTPERKAPIRCRSNQSQDARQSNKRAKRYHVVESKCAATSLHSNSQSLQSLHSLVNPNTLIHTPKNSKGAHASGPPALSSPSSSETSMSSSSSFSATDAVVAHGTGHRGFRSKHRSRVRRDGRSSTTTTSTTTTTTTGANPCSPDVVMSTCNPLTQTPMPNNTNPSAHDQVNRLPPTSAPPAPLRTLPIVSAPPAWTEYSQKDLVRVIASILGQICDANQHRVKDNAFLAASPRTAVMLNFRALVPPDITVSDYLMRISTFGGCSSTAFLLSLMYIDLLISQHPAFMISRFNIHRLIITSVLIAVKFIDDKFYDNAHFARMGGISLSELNKLEASFLGLIHYDLYVTELKFRMYTSEIEKHACVVFRSPLRVMPDVATLKRAQQVVSPVSSVASSTLARDMASMVVDDEDPVPKAQEENPFHTGRSLPFQFEPVSPPSSSTDMELSSPGNPADEFDFHFSYEICYDVPQAQTKNINSMCRVHPGAIRVWGEDEPMQACTCGV